jgi:hypothetical protein
MIVAWLNYKFAGALGPLSSPNFESCIFTPPYALRPRFLIKLRGKFDNIIGIIIIIISIIIAFTNTL